MSGQKAFKIKNYFDREIPIDDGVAGEATGETLPIRVRRFTVAQLQEFTRGWERIINPKAARFFYRKPDADEQARREDGFRYVLPDSEIERRRIVEMSDADRDAYEEAKRDDDAHLHAFCSEQIAAHIWLPPAVTLTIVDESGEERAVRTGRDLVDAFGGNLEMLTQLTRAIFEENTLSAEKKRQLRSRSASSTSSQPPDSVAAADGARPDATAANVAPEASASSVDALAAPDPIRSGLTAT